MQSTVIDHIYERFDSELICHLWYSYFKTCAPC